MPAVFIIFELVPLGRDKPSLPSLHLPIIKTSVKVCVKNVKKLIVEKLKDVSLDSSSLDILCRGQTCGNSHSLEFIRKTRWMMPDSHLVLQYAKKAVPLFQSFDAPME
jgi:hypothetical protein